MSEPGAGIQPDPQEDLHLRRLQRALLQIECEPQPGFLDLGLRERDHQKAHERGFLSATTKASKSQKRRNDLQHDRPS
ncbi:hypothetical protein EOD39_14657 [Acipenser ruthenus]|uniref:Uncharacterized protein n=1 Tax=Acipenser ruthenus TaxID=7906 RepID=A0A662YM57_ACIRT|nr:hypothetical protein EOD39_14657 [Acipenser ruthenus]